MDPVIARFDELLYTKGSHAKLLQLVIYIVLVI